MSKISWSPCALRISWRKLLRCPIIELVLSKEYATTLSQSNENASLTSLHTSYTCRAITFAHHIFHISSNYVAISPESLSTILFILQYFFLNSIAAWSAVLKRRLHTTRKPEKSSSLFITFRFKFAVTELAPILVKFLFRYAASTYSLCFEMSLCLLISFSPPCETLKSLPHTVHEAKSSHSRISEWIWIYYTTNWWISQNVSLSLTELAMNCPLSFLHCFNFLRGTNFTW